MFVFQKYAVIAIALGLMALLLAACGGKPEPRRELPPKSGQVTKIGKPYRIGGIWYYPKDEPEYEEVGVASWYGKAFHGKPTANGERFDMNKLSAAHRTLPLPSYVKVTNLSNGRSMVLRVNDRGPFAKNRIIDVSRRAAQLLGFDKKGVQKVRVQRVNKDGKPRVKQVSVAAVRESAPEEISKSNPVYLQIGAFGDKGKARAIAEDVADLGPTFLQTVRDGRGRAIHRVRIGPFVRYTDVAVATERAKSRGFLEARVFVEDPPRS